MPLTKYRRKRDFKRTPEPKGKRKPGGGGYHYVIQKHDASRLHYDFRLELNGVLKSWAVPKGPSLDPAVKALAVEVEDHPLEYASFEGIIPEGQYGGGTVMVWDQGTWEAEGDAARDLARGKLSFTLSGKKLHGGWTLVRMHGRDSGDRKNWLLIKRDDKYARPRDEYDVLVKRAKSVVSGRDLGAIARDAGAVWTSRGRVASNGRGKPKTNKTKKSPTKARGARRSKKKANDDVDPAGLPGARPARQPTMLKPQLATLVDNIPRGDEWLHEVKFDGYRLLAFVKGGHARLLTRNGKDWTARFRPVAEAVERLGLADGILDGEVVILDEEGVSNFQRLQNWLKGGGTAPLHYFVFDIPYFESLNLMQTPLADRKRLLEHVLARPEEMDNGATVQFSDHVRGGGPQVIAEACRLKVEGVISKRADSLYAEGRTRAWVKTKCLKRQEFVIGGYTRPGGSRTGFGALLLGYYEGDALKFCGRVGTGFTQDSLRQIAGELRRRRRSEPPFANPPTGVERRGVTWVEPQLVGEVEFTEWTDDGHLRHPAFQGLREDKPPQQVQREQPRHIQSAETNGRARSHAMSATKQKAAKGVPARSTRRRGKLSEEDTIAGVRLTHPDRVVFPEEGLTKRDVAEYYVQVADYVLPYVTGRPLTLVRCPQGVGGPSFFQKHLTDAMPDGVRGVSIAEKSGRRQYVVIDDLKGLIALVQIGALEFHPWPAKAKTVERPDLAVFDLDPAPGVTWKAVAAAARELRSRFDDLGLTSFLRTSGGKGLHVVLPLTGRNTWDELKSFAKSIAEAMARESPARYVATMSKAKRQGKIFVDYLRNQRGATAIASYSTRARANAPVATPVSWEELNARLRPDKFTVSNFARRLKTLNSDDPWAEFFEVRQQLPAANGGRKSPEGKDQ